MRVPFAESDFARHTRAVEERRHDADLLGDELSRSASARGTVRIKGLDLVTDDNRFLARGCAARNAQPHFVRPLTRVQRAAMQRRAADQIDAKLGITPAQALA